MAVHFSSNYRHIFTRNIALTAILVSCFLSVFVNSWSTAIEKTTDELVVKLENAENVTYYRDVQRSWSDSNRSSNYIIRTCLQVKNIYNMVIRIGYPIILAIMTISVIVGFVIQQRRRNRLARPCKRQMRREINLFQLLLLIVFLTFLQVVPAEARRILELLYPIPWLRTAIHNKGNSFFHCISNWSYIIDICHRRGG